ncbi:MAG: lipoprotein signal peptidase [Muribaculaceae bacterium]|nr:lipoprotein signal peptidase [Muribaculaceae bacterium]MDE6135571.1 lipoprotein signal peptidase [Muribaculaceae bacterium]
MIQTSKKRRLGILAVVIPLAVILIDQIVKVWIKTHFYLGQDVEVLPFFHIRFIQNNGMAFGIELGSKLFLTMFRILLVGLLVAYICRLVKAARVPAGFIVAVALVTAGAFGNIIDCVCYGEIFTDPIPPHVAQMVPWGEGYGSLLHGYVVDMLYFPLFAFRWPEWMPFFGGELFSFFDPVFNIADAAITVGMAMVILFYTKYLGEVDAENDTAGK